MSDIRLFQLPLGSLEQVLSFGYRNRRKNNHISNYLFFFFSTFDGSLIQLLVKFQALFCNWSISKLMRHLIKNDEMIETIDT